MRFQLIAIGSDGDVRPMLALGHELTRRGHSVSLTAFSAFQTLSEEAGFDFSPLPGDARQFIGSIMRPGASPLTYLTRLKQSLQGLATPFYDALFAACQRADCIVTTYFGGTPYAMAEKLGVPIFQVNYCVIDPTGDFCIPVMPEPRFGPSVNRATYRLAYLIIGLFEKWYAAPWRVSQGVDARKIRTRPDYRTRGWEVPVLYAFSPNVVQRSKEWGGNIHMTGFWHKPVQAYTPPDALAAFLGSGPKPVYIGFGSMTGDDREQVRQAISLMTAQSGLRVLLSKGWSEGLEEGEWPDGVHVLSEYVPHEWLFERVLAIVHHGGAGTTAAALRAGLPMLIIPFGGDQFFWGARMHELGCSPEPLRRSGLTAQVLAGSIEKLITTPAYRGNAQKMQLRMRGENGVSQAADLIEGLSKQFINE